MEKRPEIPETHGLCRWAIRLWFALSFRKIRLINTTELSLEGPTLLAVSHPAGFLDALILATAFEHPVHCLVSERLVRGPLAGFLARLLGMVVGVDDGTISPVAGQPAVQILAGGGTLAVFADQNRGAQASPGALARTAASLIGAAELQLAGRRVEVYPVYLFLPVSSSQSRELLVHVDSPLVRPEDQPTEGRETNEVKSLASALESSFQANPFQLRPADLEYFSRDLEAVLQASLQEDWSSRPNWKQDVEGFVLSGFVVDWVKQVNYLDPGRLVALRESLDEYRHLLQQRSLRQFEIETAGAILHSGWRRTLVWLETLLGLPLALYGALNHLAIGALLFVAGALKKRESDSRTTTWAIGGAIVLVGYALQTLFVAQRWGRATAGYYVPTLPLAGVYLWRYLWLLRHQTRLLFLSITIAALTSKAEKLRGVLLEELDRAVAGYAANLSTSR